MTRFYHNFRYLLRFPSVLLSLLIIAAPFLIVSCEEDPSEIGKGILPESDFVSVNSVNSIIPVSYTMYDDSVQTNNPANSYLGQTYDHYFGTTTAGFVTQLRLKYDWPGKGYTLDSAKLVLKFSNVIGSAAARSYLSFREISDQIYNDTAYYSRSLSLKTGGLNITGIELPLLKPDTINDLSIKLSFADATAFWTRLSQDTSMLFHSNIKPDFKSYFPGLYFSLTSTPSPVLATLSLANDNDGYLIVDRYYKNFFIFYFHDIDGKSHGYYLILDAINVNASFNVFEHDRTTADEDKKITHVGDFFVDTMYSYQQSLNGIFTRINLTGLEQIKNDPQYDNIAVNRARLTVPYYTDGTIYNNSTVPKRLYLRYRTVRGVRPIVPDYSVDTYTTFFDGAVDTINQVYNFNIPTYVQRYLEDTSGDIKPEVEVVQGSGSKNLILRANSKTYPSKFVFTYTRF